MNQKELDKKELHKRELNQGELNQKVRNKRSSIHNITTAAICLALCMVLPFLTGQVKQFGNALCPMHIPVLLCGFICGPFYGAGVGIIAPLLRFLLFGMPPIFPAGIAMCFELAVYGLAAGFLYRLLPKKVYHIYLSLVAAMLLGRLVWGSVMFMISRLADISFTWEIFLAGAFTNAVPGMILHIVLIPVLVLALRKAGLISYYYIK